MSKKESSVKRDLSQKIEQAKALLQSKKRTDNETINEILRKRAERISAGNDKNKEKIETISLLQFSLGKEHYAIKTNKLKEIIVAKQITEIPCTPAHIFGVINIRGNIVSVIDLKKVLQLDYVGINDHALIVVVDFNNSMVGIVADEIIGVEDVDIRNIQKEKLKIVKIKEEYLTGISDKTVVVLDIDKVLSDKSLVVEESV